jgi:Putative peptidoglycan binding domain
MRYHRTSSTPQHRLAIGVVVAALGLAVPVAAAESDLDRFKTEIDAFIGRLGPSTNGVVEWAGSDPYEIRGEGDVLVAVITNARLSVKTPQVDHLTLDRIEIRRIGQKEEGRLIELAVLLPEQVTLSETDGSETRIALKDARANAIIEAQSGRGRDTKIAIASVRIDHVNSGAWLSFGPLSLTSKLVTGPDGGWSAPVEFDVNKIECFFPQGPFEGGIDRITFNGKSAGPKLDVLNKLRDAVEAVQNNHGQSPEARGAAFLALLPTIPAPFSTIRGELAMAGLTVRGVTGETLVSLAKAGSTIEITGLDTEAAAIRFSVRHEGFDLAQSILDETKVPHRIVLDLGLDGLSTQALSALLRAVGTMAEENKPGEDETQWKKQQATQQAIGAVAMLNPTFHIYDIAVDTDDVGADLTAEAKGSPLAPKGYTAAADLVIRGFGAIPKLSDGIPFAEYLPVLKELSVEEKAPDGTPRVDFHLASDPPNWITINGNDVSLWFTGAAVKPYQPRLLKPSDPPMRGNDVRSLQQALAAARITVEQDGVYTSSTAAAVARFQKDKGINVSGVVDAATRQRLGLPVDAPRQDGSN